SPAAAAWAPRAARRVTAAVRRPRGTTGWGRTARDWLSREWDGLANWEPERWDRKWWDLFTERARTPNVPGRETPAASPETAGGSTPAKSVAGAAHPAGDPEPGADAEARPSPGREGAPESPGQEPVAPWRGRRADHQQADGNLAGALVTHQDTWLWEGHPQPSAYSDDTGEFTRFIEAGETS